MIKEFISYPKIRRSKNNWVTITEKIDGTNAQIMIDGADMMVGSRKRWITPDRDNFGFAGWVMENRDELMTLGDGRHYGEWWGLGIQRGYGVGERRFSLFNTFRPSETLPACVSQVPVLYSGTADERATGAVFDDLRRHGSAAAPRFMRPEGIVIYHHLSKTLIKRTLGGDEHKE